MWIVLAVLVGGGGALVYYTKPIRELAQKAQGALDTAKDSTGQATSFATSAANAAGLGPVFALSQVAYSKIQEYGGLSKILDDISADIKNQDIPAALNKIKKVGGKDVEPYLNEVEKAIKEAKGKVSDVDWQGILAKIQDSAGDELKSIINFIKPYIPASGPVIAALASGNFETISSTLTKKIKEEGGDQLKELEATAKKLYSKAEEVTKDKQLDVQSLIKQLKEVDGEDLDKVIKQVKDLARKAGLPADTIESWLAEKGGKFDTDAFVKKAQSLAESGPASVVKDQVQNFDTDKAVEAVKTISPALASLLALTLSQAGVKLGSSGKSAAKDGKEQYEQAKKQLETLTGTLSSASGTLSKDLQSRLQGLQKDLQKSLDEAPSISETTDAAKDAAKQGKLSTAEADKKKKEWEQAAKKVQDDARKHVEAALKDLEKAVESGKAGEGGKTVLAAYKKYLGRD